MPDSRPTTSLPAPPFLANALLGVGQLLLWGGSYFLLAVLAQPIAQNTGWPLAWLYGALSLGLLVAGVLSPGVGRRLARPGGSAWVRYSGVVMGLGLMVVAAAPAFSWFVLGWAIIGASMALGLYDALFAVLGKHYGQGAKGAIVQITLISGFCTTVVWPALAWTVAHWGWRGTCAGYGAVLALLIWPLHRVGLPRSPRPAVKAPSTASSLVRASPPAPGATIFWLLAGHFTLGAVITTALSVQLVAILQAQGWSTAAAVGLGALIGPSTVGVRVLDLLGPAKSTMLTALLSGLLVAAGLALLGWLPAAGIVCYGLGNGMRSILRGTLPLELFGPATYPVVMGQLALPTLVAQALTPLLGGLLAEHYGALTVLGVLGVLGVANVGLTLVLRQCLATRAARLPPQAAAA